MNHRDGEKPWRLLGVAPTGDRWTLNRAYTRKLEEILAREDPDSYLSLLEAYRDASAQQESKLVPTGTSLAGKPNSGATPVFREEADPFAQFQEPPEPLVEKPVAKIYPRFEKELWNLLLILVGMIVTLFGYGIYVLDTSGGPKWASETTLHRVGPYSSAIPEELGTSAHVDLIKEMQLRGELNLRDGSGLAPLHHVLIEEGLFELELYLQAGADPDLPDDRGWRPLHMAVSSKDLEKAALLLDYGADPDKSGKVSTPRELALERGHWEIVALFRQNDGL